KQPKSFQKQRIEIMKHFFEFVKSTLLRQSYKPYRKKYQPRFWRAVPFSTTPAFPQCRRSCDQTCRECPPRLPHRSSEEVLCQQQRSETIARLFTRMQTQNHKKVEV